MVIWFICIILRNGTRQQMHEAWSMSLRTAAGRRYTAAKGPRKSRRPIQGVRRPLPLPSTISTHGIKEHTLVTQKMRACDEVPAGFKKLAFLGQRAQGPRVGAKRTEEERLAVR